MTGRVAADAALVVRAAAGERRAWEELVDAHSGALFRTAWKLLAERDAAEDAVQETFLRLWKVAPGWRADAPVGAWLHRVATNVALDMLRRRRPSAELAEGVAEAGAGPDELADQAMDLAVLRELMAGLPERQRVALVLCRIEGLSQQEAATALGCSEESVESLLHRGRKSLRAGFAARGREIRERRSA